MRKLLKAFAFGIIGLLLVLILVWMQLSPARLAAFAKYKIEEYNTGMRVDLGPIETNLTGATLKYVSFYIKGSKRALLSLGQVEVSLAPWYLIQGAVAFDVKLYGGEISGLFKPLSTRVTLVGSSIEPALNGHLRKLQLLASKPKVNFELDMAVMKQTGTLVVVAKNLQTTKLTTQKTGLMVDLPETKLDNIDLAVDFSPNAAQIDLKAKGDLNGGVQGSIKFVSLAAAMKGKMQLNLTLRTTISAIYIKKLGFLSSLLENFQRPNGLLAVKFSGSSFAPKIDKL